MNWYIQILTKCSEFNDRTMRVILTLHKTHICSSQTQKSQSSSKVLFEQALFRIKYNISDCPAQNSSNVV